MLIILAGTEDGSAGGSGNAFVTLLFYAVIIGGLFYFLMIRPQRTRMRKHQALMAELEVGDDVQTIGGIHGRIEHLDEETVVLQIEGGGRIRVARRALAGKIG
ncbi:MAG TPA: preprotein translocase subunit YajC [Acidimicrobiia bacterium]|nr:preprotein translocase subunit YajC [Acidimicrobiia bacterium]